MVFNNNLPFGISLMLKFCKVAEENLIPGLNMRTRLKIEFIKSIIFQESSLHVYIYINVFQSMIVGNFLGFEFWGKCFFGV